MRGRPHPGQERRPPGLTALHAAIRDLQPAEETLLDQGVAVRTDVLDSGYSIGRGPDRTSHAGAAAAVARDRHPGKAARKVSMEVGGREGGGRGAASERSSAQAAEWHDSEPQPPQPPPEPEPRPFLAPAQSSRRFCGTGQDI